MLVRLVRHACAGSRDEWEGDDTERPLDPVGVEQALALAEMLGRKSAGRLRSSPTRRCTETLAPLAARWEAPVEPDPALGPDAGADELLELLTIRAADGDVLCTHGEAMEALLGRLRHLPITGHRVDLLAKGTLWEVTVAGGEVTGLRHLIPSGARPCGEHADRFVAT